MCSWNSSTVGTCYPPCPQTPCPAKPAIGYVPSPEMIGAQPCLWEVAGLKVNPKLALEDTDTTSVWCPSPRKSLLPLLEAACQELDTTSPPVPSLPNPTATKRKAEMESPSSSGGKLFSGIHPLTGKPLRPVPLQAALKRCLPMYSFAIMAHYGELLVLLVNKGDYAQPQAIEREVFVFYGPTGSGKSRRAWSETASLGLPTYSKDPRTKFWCGYRGQELVVIDEFRGGIDIAHLLRWFDRYPCSVETKGGSVPLCATKFWITSNLHPRDWFPELDGATYLALERRLQINLIE